MYDGDFKNNVFDGNGKLFYKNGKIKYEGEFMINLKEMGNIFGKMVNII